MKNEKFEKVMPNFGKKMAQPEAHVWKVGDGDAAFIESKIGMTIAVDMQRSGRTLHHSRPQDVSSRM